MPPRSRRSHGNSNSYRRNAFSSRNSVRRWLDMASLLQQLQFGQPSSSASPPSSRASVDAACQPTVLASAPLPSATATVTPRRRARRRRRPGPRTGRSIPSPSRPSLAVDPLHSLNPLSSSRPPKRLAPAAVPATSLHLSSRGDRRRINIDSDVDELFDDDASGDDAD